MKSVRFVLIVLISLSVLSACSEKQGCNHDTQRITTLVQNIDSEFDKIEQEIMQIASFTVELYDNQDRYKCEDTSNYNLSESGVFHKKENDGKSAVFVSGYFPVDEKIKEIVYFTEPLDSLFKEIVDENPYLVQAYYNDKYSYNRIYPFFDVLTQYEPKMNIPEFNFYYLADEKHNPNKKAAWVSEPYVDPAGRGWMISAIAPCYYEDELIGVPGVDVTISSITSRYLSEGNKNIMILDSSGVIVSANEFAINLFMLPRLVNHKYFETIKQDTYRRDDYNLLKNKNSRVRDAFRKIIKENSKNELIVIDGKAICLYAEPLERLNWRIVEFVSE